jgi:hypothetical protein
MIAIIAGGTFVTLACYTVVTLFLRFIIPRNKTFSKNKLQFRNLKKANACSASLNGEPLFLEERDDYFRFAVISAWSGAFSPFLRFRRCRRVKLR